MRGSHRETRHSHEAEREEELWARACTVVFAGRNRPVGVSRLRISWLWGVGLSLVVLYLALERTGQVDSALRERAQ